MRGNVIAGEQQRIIGHHVSVLPGRGTRLKIEVDDLLQRIAEAHDQVGRDISN